MEIQRTVNANGIKDAGGKDWYLSVKPASPKQTLSVRFEDGKQYKYLGTGKVNVGDPVVIDFGGATSYMMGNVSAAEDGITIKRSHALKPLFTFSAGPDKTEIKKNAEGIRGLEEVKDVAGFFADTPGQMNEDRFRVVDYLVGGVLNAITVIAFQELAVPAAVRAAKAFLAAEKPVPALVFGSKFCNEYYGEFAGLKLKKADNAEVAFTGHYPGWKDDLLSCAFWNSEAYNSLGIQSQWNKENTVYYLYFKKGAAAKEKFFAQCDEFRTVTNELVMRSALTILIRGGFANLLRAALSVEMPIKGFYGKLIAFADEIGSTECSSILKNTKYEDLKFTKVEETAPASKADFQIKGSTLKAYQGSSATVVIPDGITTIGPNAFGENKVIKKVVIPDSVTTIKKQAFVNCSKLEEVVLGNNVTTVESSCFSGCAKLRSIDLSKTGITVLANGVFKDCKGLKTMDLRTTQVTEICTHAFNGSGLASILLPSTLEIINGSVFAKTKLAEITIPASVREINFFAFLDDATKYAPMKRIVFEGTKPINFKMESVAPDCEVVCNRDCGLFTMLDKQNSELGIKAADHPTWKTAVPCKLTGV